jgi:hypothetical protein
MRQKRDRLSIRILNLIEGTAEGPWGITALIGIILVVVVLHAVGLL